jgi:hypothetical protein
VFVVMGHDISTNHVRRMLMPRDKGSVRTLDGGATAAEVAALRPDSYRLPRFSPRDELRCREPAARLLQSRGRAAPLIVAYLRLISATPPTNRSDICGGRHALVRLHDLCVEIEEDGF